MTDQPRRRFPQPWDIERSGFGLRAFRDRPRKTDGANLLTRDEARPIAANIAKLPELLRRVAEGWQDVAEVSTALRIVLQLEGVPCR
jgi:hypothetical protein